jgi:geranylgeranyl diphosphate synthase, type II
LTGGYPNSLKQLAEESLERFFPQTDPRLSRVSDAMKYSLFAPGKRFRPVLALAVVEALGKDPRIALPVACALEFIHTYSLIHDDLPAIDNDDLRRGRPTCHLKFGEDTAILAGDALYAEAFVLILTEQAKYTSPPMLIEVLKEVATATGIKGMVGGQVVDIASTGRAVDLATLEFIHNHKTGCLIRAAARCGAIVGEAEPEQVEAVTRYAEHLGLAFQIIDDILDVTGSVEMVGKTLGRDVDNRKTTFPGKMGVERSRSEAQAATDQALKALSGAGLNADVLFGLADFALRRAS